MDNGDNAISFETFSVPSSTLSAKMACLRRLDHPAALSSTSFRPLNTWLFKMQRHQVYAIGFRAVLVSCASVSFRAAANVPSAVRALRPPERCSWLSRKSGPIEALSQRSQQRLAANKHDLYCLQSLAASEASSCDECRAGTHHTLAGSKRVTAGLLAGTATSVYRVTVGLYHSS
jgi:hypothetical protein